MLFQIVPFLTPYSPPFHRLEVCNPHPNLQLKIAGKWVHIHCVQKKTLTHIFFYIFVENVYIDWLIDWLIDWYSGLCLTEPFFWSCSRSRLVPKCKPLEIDLVELFKRYVTFLLVNQQCQSTQGWQCSLLSTACWHHATMMVRNTVMIAWAALPSGFKGALHLWLWRCPWLGGTILAQTYLSDDLQLQANNAYVYHGPLHWSYHPFGFELLAIELFVLQQQNRGTVCHQKWRLLDQHHYQPLNLNLKLTCFPCLFLIWWL